MFCRSSALDHQIPVHTILHDWIRHSDGKLSFLGFVKLLHGVSTHQPLAKTQVKKVVT